MLYVTFSTEMISYTAIIYIQYTFYNNKRQIIPIFRQIENIFIILMYSWHFFR